jgi:ribose transport system permease protein
LLFAILAFSSRSFLSAFTMSVLSKQISVWVLVAVAQAFCLVVGGMNLSVGAISSMTTVILGLCLDPSHSGMPGFVAVPVALAAGAAIGLVNGLLITGLKIDSFIVTLSMMFFYQGLRSGISGGEPYRVPQSFTVIGQGNLLGIPDLFWIMMIIMAAVAFMFRNTAFGRRLLATGGNLEAARLSGINTDRMIVAANILSGLFAALAAVLWASKQGTASPETGDDWLIYSFAIAIIGGTGLNGGVVSAVGIFMGATIFALIIYSLSWVNPNYANAFLGGLILIAIVIDRGREIYQARRTGA